MRRFENKTVIVTGASAGIGAAAARAFAAEGARLVLAARGPEALERLANDLRREGGTALAVPTDVADPAACQVLLDRARDAFGGVDVLVNSAGFNVRGPVEDFPVDELAKVIDVDLRAPIVLSRLVLPYLRERGGGAIVNVASLAGRLPIAGQAAYCAAKMGLRVFTFALAEELRGTGIRVSAVSPGPVDTAFIMSEVDRTSDITLAQPISRAEDVAAMILDSAVDGKRERVRPRLSALMATAGYLFPGLAGLFAPLWRWRGRRVKARLKEGWRP